METAKQQLQVAPPVELIAAVENYLLAPVDDDLPSTTSAPEGEQLPVMTTPNV